MNTQNEATQQLHYSTIIEWSDEDNAYIVILPEFPGCHTHGATREEALKNGQEVLELLIESFEDGERPLPPARLFNLDEPYPRELGNDSKEPRETQAGRQKAS